MINRIAKFMPSQPRRNLGYSAWLEGELCRRRGDSLPSLIARGMANWPGDSELRSGLVALAVLSYLGIGRRPGSES